MKSEKKPKKIIKLGRFQVKSEITIDYLKKNIDSKNELKYIPVICEADFGHTLPLFTFPIGAEIALKATSSEVKLVLIKR